jgi:V/A-type H+-transporting ATPase subunit A
MEIVKLIGSDVLPEDQKLVIEIARVVRVGFLQQNAYHKDDTYVPLEKQFSMMGIILDLYDKCAEAVSRGVTVNAITSAGIFEKVVKMKYDIPNDRPQLFKILADEMLRKISTLETEVVK